MLRFEGDPNVGLLAGQCRLWGRRGKKDFFLEKRNERFWEHPDCRFIGFGGFSGLPESWAGRGVHSFDMQGEPPRTNDPRVSYVKGYFQNSPRGFLQTYKPRPPTLIHFDADLYSSTVFLLASLWHHIPEYYFCYDEFVPDELLALNDFASAFPVELQFLACTANNGDSSRPQQLFGISKNVPLVV